MKISETVDYPASPDEVFAMLTDERFQARKCEEAGALSHDVAVSPAGDGTRVVTKRDLPTQDLPDFAKSLIGPRLTITETYEWAASNGDGSRTGDLTVELGGAPVSLRAKVRLAPQGAATQMTLDGDLKASVPLIGGRIERSAAPAIVDGIRSEAAVGRAWLAGER
ncbi:hypothetical protein N864_19230 [Intrasporangium chromatireducens Q5-1]|uniref:Proteinase inhibitor I25 cystatin n=1 Tax=Intrasporangium chromatireducens Q5-1 TaxID=584657 RepID=W9GM37_9MICO|nr:DUF2505 domain-containing protein [Intrasporangium chromatireducens]EWT04954.1 hypothetical protein N864_19230 [Intrasporangium chromatireducens Q5-1]